MPAMRGILLAPDDYPLAPDPTWQRIDTDYRVQSWSIDRGRQTEMSRTDTGTATINLVDTNGDFDPTNTSGAFYGRAPSGAGVPMGPLVQAAICLQNPVDETWATLYRGFISSIEWTPYRTEQLANVTVSLVDAQAIFAACEMSPNFAVFHGGDFKDGEIIYYEIDALNAVRTRINHVLDSLGFPTAVPRFRSIFTGNVKLQESKYSFPGSTAMQVMLDAADAEFPDIANLFIGGPGHEYDAGAVVFHGRLARFDPTNPDYGLITWQAGDDTAAAADPDNVVRISPPLVASIDDTLMYTAAVAMPQSIFELDVSAQYVYDATAVATKGLRTWSAENLQTLAGSGRTGLQETRLFADYVRDNYPTPRVRVGQLTIKSRDPDSIHGLATYALLCGIDISDRVHLRTTHAGGGGFNEYFFVEGIHYTARPGGGNPYVELVLDVTPSGYYDANPFA